jgi:hypothetical protein
MKIASRRQLKDGLSADDFIGINFTGDCSVMW